MRIFRRWTVSFKGELFPLNIDTYIKHINAYITYKLRSTKFVWKRMLSICFPSVLTVVTGKICGQQFSTLISPSSCVVYMPLRWAVWCIWPSGELCSVYDPPMSCVWPSGEFCTYDAKSLALSPSELQNMAVDITLSPSITTADVAGTSSMATTIDITCQDTTKVISSRGTHCGRPWKHWNVPNPPDASSHLLRGGVGAG